MLTDLLIVALAAAFVTSFADRWLNGGIFRGLISLAVSVGGFLVFDYSGWTLAVISASSAFLSLIMILLGERLATPPPLVVDSRRR